MTTTTRKLTSGKIYWDTSDPNNHGWAYKLYFADDHMESGPVDLLDETDAGELDDELIRLCEIHGVTISVDDIRHCEEQGYVEWSE